MSILNFIKNFYITKASQKTNNQTLDTLIDLSVSLSKDYTININLSMEDNISKSNLSPKELALVYAEFLNIIMSSGLETQILDIIITQIKNKNNEDFIENILAYLIIMENKKNNNSYEKNAPIIKPSQAFAKYKNG